jgi:predicted AAA+ superfamily ATPase
MQGMKRQYEQLIREYLGYFPCVVLIGARQTGKSTIIGMLDEKGEIFDLVVREDYQKFANDLICFCDLMTNKSPLTKRSYYRNYSQH